MKFPVFTKSHMRPYTINGNSHQRGPQFLKLFKHFVVECQLVAADRTPVCGVEYQDDISPFKFGQANLLVGSRRKDEIWRFRAYGKYHRILLCFYSESRNSSACFTN